MESKNNIHLSEAIHIFCLVALAVSYILGQLFSIPNLLVLTEIIAVITVIESLPLIRGVSLYISLVLLGAGFFLLYIEKASLYAYLNGFGQNAGLIVIFVLTPQLAIPLRWEIYTRALEDFYCSYVHSKGRLCLFSALLTHFLGIILNIGAVAVVYGLVRDNVRGDSQRLIISAINRGFNTSVMWSPYFAAMALVLGKMRVPWSSIAMYCFFLAMIGLASGFLMDYSHWAKGKRLRARADFMPESRNTLLTMFFCGILLTAVMLVLEWFFGLNMISIVCIIAVLFPLFWSFLPAHKKVYREGVRKYFRVTLPLLRKEAVLFLSAGFFANAVAVSQISKYILDIVQGIAVYGLLSLQMTVILTIVLLAMMGIHPVIPVSVLATSAVSPGGLPAGSFAMVLMAGWALANISSPFNAVNMMLSGFSGINPIEVSLRWNMRYVMVNALIFSVLLTLFDYIAGTP